MFYENGETIAVIADYFQCDPKTIRRRAKELGLRHPNSPHRRQKRIYTRLDKMDAVQRYEQGESLMGLAALGKTSVDVVRPYLRKRGVKIRTRVEQAAMAMAKYGTRFHAKDHEEQVLALRRKNIKLQDIITSVGLTPAEVYDILQSADALLCEPAPHWQK